MKERAPPPLIVFEAKLNVAHDDGNFGTCDHEHNQTKKQEPENIVILVQPEGSHGEV